MTPNLPWSFVVTTGITGGLILSLVISGQAQPKAFPEKPSAPPTVVLPPKVLSPLEADVVNLRNTVTQQASLLNSIAARVQQLEIRLKSAESKLVTHESKISLLCGNMVVLLPLPTMPGVTLSQC